MAQAASERTNRRWPARQLALLLPLLFSASVLTAEAQQPAEIFAEGDVLKITAYDREDITGTYAVQPGPLLSLPLIGTVSLENQGLRRLETELAKAWENRLGTPMSITIEFAERAPFYVVGAVNSPGAYPYRNGMTVLQAIAVSGGIEKQLGSSDDRIRLDVLRERERLQQATDRLAQAIARRARLMAEREDRPQITLETAVELVPEERLQAIIAEENRLLDARREQSMLKEKALAEQVRLGEAEIASYQQQYNTMSGQQEQITKEANRIRRLPGQQTRVFELDQRSTTLEATKASLVASITRAKTAVETARNGVAELREARQSEISEALLDADRSIKENQLAVEAARSLLGAAGAGETAVSGTLVFSLVRPGTEGSTVVQSTSTIRPGDLIEVSFSDNAAPAQPSQDSGGEP
ncbi:SLBB domain-containing protein [Aestuariivirga sp.]|uniref:SLBB domain-containing protein n=1 Tax=Aestuariivirga sp. TaxID=2650926 RepID=UPI0039196757